MMCPSDQIFCAYKVGNDDGPVFQKTEGFKGLLMDPKKGSEIVEKQKISVHFLKSSSAKLCLLWVQIRIDFLAEVVYRIHTNNANTREYWKPIS